MKKSNTTEYCKMDDPCRLLFCLGRKLAESTTECDDQSQKSGDELAFELVEPKGALNRARQAGVGRER